MGSVTVLWDTRTDRSVMRLETSHGAPLSHHHVTCVAVHPDQPHRLVTGVSDGRVTLYDLRVNAALQSHTSHSSHGKQSPLQSATDRAQCGRCSARNLTPCSRARRTARYCSGT
jgi:WD40 repeat protein